MLPPKNMGRREVEISIAGRLRSPITIERLALAIDTPRGLVSEVVRRMARARNPKIVVVGTCVEDGETRVLFQEKEYADGSVSRRR